MTAVPIPPSVTGEIEVPVVSPKIFRTTSVLSAKLNSGVWYVWLSFKLTPFVTMKPLEPLHQHVWSALLTLVLLKSSRTVFSPAKDMETSSISSTAEHSPLA